MAAEEDWTLNSYTDSSLAHCSITTKIVVCPDSWPSVRLDRVTAVLQDVCCRLIQIEDAENTLARRSGRICRTQTISAMVEVLEDAIWEYRRGAVACGSSPMA